MSLADGTTIGPYRTVRKIGEGGMGAVYLAEHALIGRRAAIKVLLPTLSSEREIVERFFNEARATTAVSDPGIVQVFDFGYHVDGSAFIVMELLEGESLDARIHRGALAVVDALRVARQVAGSLAAAHARGIVHRDLKPDNLYLVRDPEAQGGERPKILDFGIAKLSGDAPDRTRTRTGMLLGTPIYMSPEQCRGTGSIDHRSDIYSLGCVLYHMVTGRPPFDLDGMGEIISAHLREAPTPPSAHIATISPAVDELVLRCLAKAPEQRFGSMIELQAACEALLARISVAGAQTLFAALPAAGAGSPPTTLRHAVGESTVPVPRRGLGWLAIAGGVIAAGAIAVVLAVRPGGSDDAPAPATGPRAGTIVAAPADAAVAPVAPQAAAPVPPVDAAAATPTATITAPPAPTPRRRPAPPPPAHHPSAPARTTPQEDPYDSR